MLNIFRQLDNKLKTKELSIIIKLVFKRYLFILYSFKEKLKFRILCSEHFYLQFKKQKKQRSNITKGEQVGHSIRAEKSR